MSGGPTTGAVEMPNEWRASPKLAALVRVIAFATPIAIAAVVIRLVSPILFRPDGVMGLIAWIVQATLVGALVSRTVGQATRRLLPLATLLMTTLVFPDRAPSRFGVALRAGTVKKLRERAAELGRSGLGATEAEAAENAIVMVTALGRHDRLTRGHTERVRAYADLIAEEMGFTQAERGRLAWGVLLHDVGKMTVPAEILNKKEKLTDDEWQILKNHPAAGHAMLAPLAGWLGEWRGAAGEHHERWDGRGYPNGLAGDEISRAGRITAVADAYDVITSKRSYKEPMSPEAARRELVRCAGDQFDPAVVRAMMAVSLGHPALDGGPLAWISDLRTAQAVGMAVPSPVAAGLGVAAVTLGSLLGLLDDPAARESAIAAGLAEVATEEGDGDTVPVTTDGSTVVTSNPTSVAPAVAPATPPTPGAAPADDDPPDAIETITPSPVDRGEVPPPGVAATSTTSTVAPDDGPPTTSAPSPTTSAPPATPPTAPTTVAPVPITIPLVTTTVPEPPITAPPVTVPPVTVPPVSVPPVTVPSVTVPSVTVPSVTVPSITTPIATTPEIRVPPITTPAVATPAVATPEVTTPAVTTPAVTTPTPVPTVPVLEGLLRQG